MLLSLKANATPSSFLDQLHQVANFEYHPSNLWRIRPANDLVEFAEAQASDYAFLILGKSSAALHKLDFQFFGFRFHLYLCITSSGDFPRILATPAASLSWLRPSIVAFTTLCGLALPNDLVKTFWIPTDWITARTGPPAMTPVPSGAGFSSTLPDPKRPTTRCGIDVPIIGTFIKFFLAASTALRIACGTSLALPLP